MVVSPVTRVEYQAPGSGATIAVERLRVANLSDGEIIGLRALAELAYQVQLGGESAFNPRMSAEQLAEERSWLEEAVTNDHRMWVIRNPQAENDLEQFDGFAELMPKKKGVWLEEIHVRPPFGRGNGSLLLHAGLTADLWPGSRQLGLDIVPGSSSNNMYHKLGMVLFKGAGKYPQMVTPKGYGTKGIIAALEKRRPELTQARML